MVGLYSAAGKSREEFKSGRSVDRSNVLLKSQSGERPDRYREPPRFETIPSKPIRPICRSIGSLQRSNCSFNRIPAGELCMVRRSNDFNWLEFHSDKRGAGHSDKWCHFVLRPSFLGRLPYGTPLLRALGDLPRGAFHVMLENLRRPVSALRHDLPIA